MTIWLAWQEGGDCPELLGLFATKGGAIARCQAALAIAQHNWAESAPVTSTAPVAVLEAAETTNVATSQELKR